VKDRVKVVLGPDKMESCPKPPKGEGNNFLSKTEVEKALVDSTYPMPLFLLRKMRTKVSCLLSWIHYSVNF
jgi:hypothetical protein